MSVAAIVWANLLRLFRDRLGLFFIFLLPAVLILVLGIQFGGGFAPRIGLVAGGAGPHTAELEGALRQVGTLRLDVRRFDDEAQLRAAVERARVEIGVILPDDYDARLERGDEASVTLLGRATSTTSAVRTAVASAIAAQSARVGAASFIGDRVGLSTAEAMRLVQSAETAHPPLRAQVESVGEAIWPEQLDQFSVGAQSQLLLFVFLTSLTAATLLVESRRLGVTRRMLAAPVRSWTILAGETTGRFAVALVQALFIVLLSAVVFGVDWGDPLGAASLVIAFCLVASGTAMLLGVVATNTEQAGTFGVFAGLALGAVGGCMVPLEIFPSAMRTIAHLTPHAWALDGFRELIFRGGGLGEVLPQVGVLLAMAAVLLALGVYGLRRRIAG